MGFTNIGYETFQQVIDKVLKRAIDEMWSEDKKNSTLETYATFMPGGYIHLAISRTTIGAANTEWFTIIVQDSSEKEIYRKTLKSDIADTPSYGNANWSNSAIVSIQVPLKKPFYVYVIDALGTKNKRFKFLIK